MSSKISKELLLGTASADWVKLLECNNSAKTKQAVQTTSAIWGGDWTRSVLKVQLTSICLLAWLVVAVYGSYLPVKTTLSSDLVPLWALWVVAIYTLSISIGYSFHYYPSMFGIGASATLQLMTLAFSGYFELISLAAMDQHGRLDKNDITRLWGAQLYSGILAVNAGVILTSFALVLTSFRDLCGSRVKRRLTNVV